MNIPLRFGLFLPPIHRPNQAPANHFQADLEQIAFADTRGFDEAWIGEHHGGGWEIISSPELMIAAAAERTARIKLGTGVSTLPYQHPFILANRAVQLDHMTRGRFIFGTGPGSHVSDAMMMGLDTGELRRMQHESIEAIIALLQHEVPVTRKTDWFQLTDAELHLPTFSKPRFEIATTVLASPSGPTLAGKFGLSLLSLGSTSPAGFEFLKKTWTIVEESALENGQVVDRQNWRLVAPMHIAETEELARKEVAYGLPAWMDDFTSIVGQTFAGMPVGEPDINKRVEALNALGYAVIGTPDMAIAQIKRLRSETNGFGVLLLLQVDWASPENTKKSLDLVARYVASEFQDQLAPQRKAQAWLVEHSAEVQAKKTAGTAKAVADHERAQRIKKQTAAT